MYMYYIIRYLIDEKGDAASSRKSYILATDADINFTAQDVTALLIMLARDKQVGAVCGRTYPIGSGPLVWYQVFDYAIGHWFQKAAEHVLGSVLCCPGCFSMYRIDALREVVTEYSSEVHRPFEFLIKDMGEDRWLCTLLVVKGWRLDYCAVAKDKTYCPENFKEFYNQRRRWIVSTLANMVEVISHGSEAIRRNESISWLYIFYQMLMLVSTVMSPATVLLVMIGGFAYILKWNLLLVYILLFSVTLFYLGVCLYLNQDKQILIAKLLTGIFAVIMALVFIGLMAQVGDNVKAALRPPPPPTTTTTTMMTTTATMTKATTTTANLPPVSATPDPRVMHPGLVGTTMAPARARRSVPMPTSGRTWVQTEKGNATVAPTGSASTGLRLPALANAIYWRVAALAVGSQEEDTEETLGHKPHVGGRPDELSTSSIYLMVMIGMFFVCGFLHLGEIMALIHGWWYLLCLPSGYLFLLLYSCCNLDDRSWGTREGAAAKAKSVSGVSVEADAKVSWYRSMLLGCGLRPNERLSHFMGRIFCCQYWRDDSQTLPPPPVPEEPTPERPLRWHVRRTVGEGGHTVHVVECLPVKELVDTLNDPDRTAETIEALLQHAVLAFPSLYERALRRNAQWPQHFSLELCRLEDSFLAKLTRDAAAAEALAADLMLSASDISANFREHLNERASLQSRNSTDHLAQEDTLGAVAVPVDVWLRRNGLDNPDLAARLRFNGFSTAALAGLITTEDIEAMAVGDLVDGYVVEQALTRAVNKQKRERVSDSPADNVNQWLTKMGMGEYIYHFEWFGFSNVDMELVATLTERRLRQMGVERQGHLRQLLSGVEVLRTQLNAEKTKRERSADESLSLPKKYWGELSKCSLESLDRNRRKPEQRTSPGARGRRKRRGREEEGRVSVPPVVSYDT